MEIKQLKGHQERLALLYMLWAGLLIPNDEQLVVWFTLLGSNWSQKEQWIHSLSVS